MSTNSPSKDYVFSSDANGKLSFKGDFDEYYKHEHDPWDQSATGESSEYYLSSRNRLAKLIRAKKPSQVLEIGCGLGYACAHFNSQYVSNYSGWDISEEAIRKAKEKFPSFTFNRCDITTPLTSTKKYDVVILNQLLWYILPQIDQVMDNCSRLLSDNGLLIVANAFAREQKYGVEFIDGFGGAFNYFNLSKHQVKLIQCEYNDEGFRNLDGVFIFNKK
ncbi:class I SAM-dependent methyltransferase [Aliiglaciecola sp. SL4]|uniref:class I SAM-dependent methyltransferase n=1 Tax=Aliiglaciecola sp. SL4 TaxID=3239806 RepID=UPI00355C9DBB